MAKVEPLEALATTHRGSGRPLLLVHGFTGCARDWHHVFAEPPNGRELIAVDLPGHGRSSSQLQEDEHFLFAAAAQRLAETVRSLGYGAEGVDAIGLSGGALTLLHLALQAPQQLNRLVLVSATPSFPPRARSIMAMVSPEGQPESEWQAMRQRHPGGDEQIRRLWRWSHNLRWSGDDVDFTPEALERIAVPTLLVHGDRDPLYPLPLALQLYEGLRQAALWVVPGGGHGPIFGEQAAPFRERALAFLAES